MLWVVGMCFGYIVASAEKFVGGEDKYEAAALGDIVV